MSTLAAVNIKIRARRGVVLSVWLTLFFLALAGAAAAGWVYWFAPSLASTQPDHEGQQLKLLADRVDSQLALADQMAALLALDINDRRAHQRLAQRLDLLPQHNITQLGLTAASYWPNDRRATPAYLTWQDEQWRSADLKSLPRAELISRQDWFLLALGLGQNQCIWSGPERENISGQTVLSCTRPIYDGKRNFIGVIRLSFATSVLVAPILKTNQKPDLVLLDGLNRVLGSNNQALAGSRNLAGLAQTEPALGPLAVKLFQQQEDALQRVTVRRDFPTDLADELVQAEAAATPAAARQLIATAFGRFNNDADMATPATCASGYCARSIALDQAAWRIVKLAQQNDAALGAQLQQGITLTLLPLLGFFLLSYLLIRGTLLNPLERLTENLGRTPSAQNFDKDRGDEFGHIARALVGLGDEKLSLLERLNSYRQEAATGSSSGQRNVIVSKLPLPAMLMDHDGRITEISPSARKQLGLDVGDSCDRLSLRAGNGSVVALNEIPANLEATTYHLVEVGNESRGYKISTAPYRRGLLVVLAEEQTGHANVVARDDAAIAPAHPEQQAREQLRRAINEVDKECSWLALRVTAEQAPANLAEPDQRQAFEEQIRDRIVDRLEDGESLISWRRDTYVIWSSESLRRARAEELGDALQTALVFCEGQRVRLYVQTRPLDINPGIRVEEIEGRLSALLNDEDEAESGQKSNLRSHSPRHWESLVTQGFTSHRFQLITERGVSPERSQDPNLIFRVLPHLEDDDGFWLESRDFLPAVQRLGRRADLDCWICTEVQNALQNLQGTRPQKVFIPLSAESLLASNNRVAELVGGLAHDPELGGLRIVISTSMQDLRRSAIDVALLRSMCHSLSCELAFEGCTLQSDTLVLIERGQPDFIIPQAQLLGMAAKSASFAIGLESLLRVADRNRAKSVLTQVNGLEAKHLAEKLKADLAFGTAIERPSPLLFQKVA